MNRTGFYIKAACYGFLLAAGIYALHGCSATAVLSESEQLTPENVRAAVESREYKIDATRMQTMRGRSRTLSFSYYIEIDGDSLVSYLPYVGRAYTVPYGGDEGLDFDGQLTDYRLSEGKRGQMEISFKTRSRDDGYGYRIVIWPENGSADISIQPVNKEPISFTGRVNLRKKKNAGSE